MMSLRTALLLIVMALALFPVAAAAEAEDQSLSPAGLAVVQLSSTVPSVQLLQDYNADNDPEHLLGRPGQYLAKAAMIDSNIDSSGAATGIIEVFPTEAALNARLTVLSARNEIDVPAGSVLLRLAGNTPAGTVTAYQSTLSGFVVR
jgi:hypothetical protein